MFGGGGCSSGERDKTSDFLPDRLRALCGRDVRHFRSLNPTIITDSETPAAGRYVWASG